MNPRPEGHWPKILRAEEHLAAVRSEIDWYRELDPCGLRHKFESPTEYVARVGVVHPMPRRLPILIGDCVSTMLAALEHLAYRLVEIGDPDRLANPRSIRFPIDYTPDGSGDARDFACIKGAPARALAVIKANQPCARGDGASTHPLTRIKRLANIDKHRQLLLAAAYLTEGFLDLRVRRTGDPAAEWVPLGRAYVLGVALEPDAEVARFFTTREYFAQIGCTSPDDVKVDGYSGLTVVLTEAKVPTDKPVVAVLEECLTFVRNLVDEIGIAAGLV